MGRYTVYTHTLNGKVVYVGSGSGRRFSSKASRTDEHLAVWSELVKTVTHSCLSKEESLAIEQQLLDKYWESGLFNRQSTAYSVRLLKYEDVADCFIYAEDSPTKLRHKYDKAGGNKAGTIAGGALSADGYCKVRYKGKMTQVSRLVYCLCSGENLSSDLVVDHIDRNKANNSFSNLRATTQSENGRNRKRKKNSTGHLCIYRQGDRPAFQVLWTENMVQKNERFSFTSIKRMKNGRNYNSKEEALAAALEFRNKLVAEGKILLVE